MLNKVCGFTITKAEINGNDLLCRNIAFDSVQSFSIECNNTDRDIDKKLCDKLFL